jgi:hypothetical protein
MLWLAAPLLLLTPTAEAGSRWLQNDVFTGEGSVGIGATFADGECAASLFVPDVEDYPFSFEKIRMYAYSETGASATVVAGFYQVEGTDMPGTRLGEEALQVTGSENSFNEVAVADFELELPEIEEQNVAVALCFTEDVGKTRIAYDDDAEANDDLNWIYTGGSWADASGYPILKNWIIRVCIEGPNVRDEGCGSGEGDADTDSDADSDTDSDSDSDSDLALLTVTPGSAAEGEAVSVVLLGQGFTDGAEARIGGIPLTGQALVNGETLTGRTPTTLPAGTHDVEVVQDGESAILIGAFTVEGGKLCATRSGSGSAWATGLALVMGLLTRRRSPRS